MKRLILCVIAVFLLSAAARSEAVTAESKVVKATVYNDRALITREAVFNLAEGCHELLLPNIPAGIDENSVRVALADEGLAILSIETGNSFSESSENPKIAELDAKILAVSDSIKQLDDSLTVLNLKEDFLKRQRAWGEEQSKEQPALKLPGVKELKELSLYLEEAYTDIYKKKAALEPEKRKLSARLEVLQAERNNLSPDAGKTYKTVRVWVEAGQTKKYRLYLNYITAGAFWKPVYDIRGFFEEKKVTVSAFGAVSQSTGEDWKGVDLELSTARPSLGGRMPELFSRYLSFEPPFPAFGAAFKAGNAVAFMKKQNMEERNAADKLAQPAMEAAEMSSGATAVFYKIKRKSDIVSGGRPRNVEISEDSYGAEFQYEAAPELSTTAFLKSSVRNGENSLLAGTANIYLGGEYSGQSVLKSALPGETIDLYFRADEGIKLERKEVKAQDENTGFIIAEARRVTKAYKLTVDNLKSKPVTISINERVPVSKDEKIKVEITKCEPARSGDIKDGIFGWKLELKPGEKRELYYEYKIESPKDRPVYTN